MDSFGGGGGRIAQACPAHFPFPSPVNRNPLPWGEPIPQHGIQDPAPRQLPLSPSPAAPPATWLLPSPKYVMSLPEVTA